MTDVVHVVVPASMDDPRRPSGGNVYDRRLCDELSARRWRVCTHFDGPGLASCVDLIPDDAVVLVDAIVATAATDVFLAHARRLRLVVLSHMPFATADEAHVLAAARAVVTTSAWSRDELLRRYPIAADEVYVASPGADAAALAEFSSRGGNLLCVGAVAPHKGHDVLIEALGRVADLRWHCVLVGALDLDPAFVVRLRRQAASDGIAARLSFAGPLDREALETTYRTTDLLLSASHSESYGMVVTEALAHGIPVLATDVGGVAEALGQDRGGRPPGRLVPPQSPVAMSMTLREWLDGAALRADWRSAAAHRRGILRPWAETADVVERVLQRTMTSLEVSV
jgi:glycosyltransferase involved in cell wall biosynthesis